MVQPDCAAPQNPCPLSSGPAATPQGVAHRDIKLENALLHEVPNVKLPLVKICDLGYAKNNTQSMPHTKVRGWPTMRSQLAPLRHLFWLGWLLRP